MKRYASFSRRLLSLLLALISIFLLVSCTMPPPDPPVTPSDATYTVMVSCSTGVSVTSTNPLTVNEGDDAQFDVAFESGYVYKSSEGATYDSNTGKLTVSAVSKNTNIDLFAEEVDFDTTVTYRFYYFSASDIICSVASGSEVKAGDIITVKANNEEKKFVGWKFDGSSDYASTDTTFTFVAKPEYLSNDRITLRADFIDKKALYYDVNGGSVNSSSTNYLSTDYYKASMSSGKVKVVHNDRYYDMVECPFSFWDDGTFTRAGYVLKEYNTAADGSGTSYSLGSMIQPLSDGSLPTLYCIWEEETASAFFTYEDVTVERPSGVSEENAPLWVEQGVRITCYTGNESTVVIPEKLGGKYVISIGAGAFTNKSIDTLVMNKRLLTVEDGAFVGCDSLKTVYFCDNIYSMNDEALDAASYTSLTHMYVNACMAPRFSTNWGYFSIKLSRLLAPSDVDRVIVVAGSSTYQGLGTEYLEALLEKEYRVVNFGTTRTTHGTLYLEAMGKLAREGDVILYAPENSAYMFGESELYWKTLRDMETMLNLWRCIDLSNYTGFFGAYSDFNNSLDHGRYYMSGTTAEKVCEICYKTSGGMDKYGDYYHDSREVYCNDTNYTDTYCITLNEYVKSKNEGEWNDDSQKDHYDYANDTVYWSKITDEKYKTLMNKAIDAAKSSGADVLFAFAPADGTKLVAGAETIAWLNAYDSLISDTYNFDGLLGSAQDYIYDHKYLYNCAFHLNDYGRTYRTYMMYKDLCDYLEITEVNGIYDCGTDFSGCLFEEGSEDGLPLELWVPIQ